MKYIGTKIVQAEPAYKFTGAKPGCKVPNQIGNEDTIALLEDGGWEIVDKREGYKVVYQDGYVSWSPKEVFEEAYRRTDGMSFGLALEAAKLGKRIARWGWNGKGMFLYYVPAAAYPPSTEVAKEAFGGENVPYGAYIAMKTAQDNVVPWLASQTDMLADDWYIVED